MSYVFAGISYFIFVFFKAFQQRNVAFMHYVWVLPTSYAMAFCEVVIHSLIARNIIMNGIDSRIILYAVAIGTGGGLGCVVGMALHNRFVTKKQRNEL